MPQTHNLYDMGSTPVAYTNYLLTKETEMKIYLGLVPADADREPGAFESGGNTYDFEIEVNSEMIRINDGVGRCMPIDISDVGDFAEMLGRINRMLESTKKMDEYLLWELQNVSLTGE